MTLYEVLITNHIGLPFFKWENPNKPKKMVNVVRYTRFPPGILEQSHKEFELECGYIAAMSISARGQNMEIVSIKKNPKTFSDNHAENEQDIIFDVSIDSYMNEHNLIERMARISDNLIFSSQRKRLEDLDLSDEEQSELVNILSDVDSRKLVNSKDFEIANTIKEILGQVKGEEKKLYEYGILGVGLLSSCYTILFYKSIKTYLELSNDQIDYSGTLPENERDLDNILEKTQIPFHIDGGESTFAYPYGENIQFIIYNFDIGPEVLDVREPLHLIVGVRVGSPSKQLIDDLIRGLTPLLID